MAAWLLPQLRKGLNVERELKRYKLEAASIPDAISAWEKKLAEGAEVTRHEQEQAFFVYLTDTLDAVHAAKKACIPMGVLTSRRKRSEKFNQRWESAIEQGKGRLRVLARKWAMEGNEGLLRYFLDKEWEEQQVE